MRAIWTNRRQDCVNAGSALGLATDSTESIMEDRIRIRSEEVLSDDWAVLKKTVLDYRRRDGQWETQIRQTYDRGDGAVIPTTASAAPCYW
jgi:hypothetical protein